MTRWAYLCTLLTKVAVLTYIGAFRAIFSAFNTYCGTITAVAAALTIFRLALPAFAAVGAEPLTALFTQAAARANV